MKSKTKFIWIYTIILFAVALMLILIAGMTQQDYEKELESHENAAVGMQKSVTELSQTNTALKEENRILKEENETLKASQSDYEQLNDSYTLTCSLIAAYSEFEKGNTKSAKGLLSSVDESILTEDQLVIYNKIMK